MTMSELAMRHFMADGGGDPGGGLADAALVAGGAGVALPQARDEGEEVLIAAVRAAEAEEGRTSHLLIHGARRPILSVLDLVGIGRVLFEQEEGA